MLQYVCYNEVEPYLISIGCTSTVNSARGCEEQPLKGKCELSICAMLEPMCGSVTNGKHLLEYQTSLIIGLLAAAPLAFSIPAHIHKDKRAFVLRIDHGMLRIRDDKTDRISKTTSQTYLFTIHSNSLEGGGVERTPMMLCTCLSYYLSIIQDACNTRN